MICYSKYTMSINAILYIWLFIPKLLCIPNDYLFQICYVLPNDYLFKICYVYIMTIYSKKILCIPNDYLFQKYYVCLMIIYSQNNMYVIWLFLF